MFVTFAGELKIQSMELILTRHGETLENRQDIMQGHMPGTLSALGKEQARKLAELLREEKIDAVVCSDLARSYDTAKIVGEHKGLLPSPTPLLREIDWGKYTGGHLSAIDWTHLPEGCETLESLLHRAGVFIGWLWQNYAGKSVLAVGHGVINRAIIAFLENKSPEEMTRMPIMKNTFYRKLEI